MGGADVPSISVLTPIWRPHPVYFRETIASVLAQTHADFEYVIVEDPSEISAALIVAEFDDPRIRCLVNPERTSLVAQRNRAVAESRGEWLALIDGDDVCEPDRLARQLSFVRDRPEIDVLGTALTIIDDRGETIGVRPYPISHDEIVRQLPRRNPIGNPSVLMRRQALLDAGGYRYARYVGLEDYDLWCRMALAGRRFANMSERLTRYRIQPGQLKRQKLGDMIRGTLDVKRTHFPHDRALGSLVRRCAESALLYLPPALVMRLFLMSEVRARRKIPNGDAPRRSGPS